MDFDKLSASEVDALDGAKREAYYAWRNGDKARADAILNTYGIVTATAPKPRTRRASSED